MELEILRQKIIKDIQDSGLHISVIYYLFKDILNQIDGEYHQFLAMNVPINKEPIKMNIKEEEDDE